MSRQLFKSTAVVSSMTLISRILGFVRDMLIARIFGVDLATDAFFVVFKIPNFLRRLFSEGAFAHAFVPILADYKSQEDQKCLKLFVDKTMGSLAFILLLITLLGIVVAPLSIMIIAPGFDWQGTQYDLAVLMFKITFPYLFFIGLVAFSGGILNAHDKFAIPALTPVFLNVTMIVAAIWIAPLMDEPIIALAWSVFAAGVIQLLFQLPFLIRLGLLPRFRWGFNDPQVKKMLSLMGPAIFSVSITQINLLIDTLIASFLTVGSVSWLYYSDRLVEFPVGILGLALGTVILPRLAKDYAVQDNKAFSQSLDWGLRLVLLIGTPATIGLFLLAEPMLSTLFQYREFGWSDVYASSLSLKAYSLGLLGYILIKILVPGFTARQDVKTPVRYGIYAMVFSLVLDVLLVFPLAHAGLALATSLTAFFNAALLLKKLLQKNIYQPIKGWKMFFIRVFLASVAMSSVLYYWVDVRLWNDWSSMDRLINLFKWIVIGFFVYGGALVLLGGRWQHVSVNIKD